MQTAEQPPSAEPDYAWLVPHRRALRWLYDRAEDRPVVYALTKPLWYARWRWHCPAEWRLVRDYGITPLEARRLLAAVREAAGAADSSGGNDAGDTS